MTKQNINIKADINSDDSRSFTATITTNAIDRDGEVLLPEGMRSKDFESNPVVFWNHNYDMPIGKATDLSKQPNAWSATAELAKRPDGHEGEWFPDTVHALMRQGIIRGVSVGFQPIESRNPSKKDVATFGDEVTRVYSKWNLLEFSVAPLQANQEALVTAVSKGLVTSAQAKAVFPDVELPAVTEAPRPAEAVEDETAAKARKRILIPTQQKRRKVYLFVEQAAPVKRKRKTMAATNVAIAVKRELALHAGRLFID